MIWNGEYSLKQFDRISVRMIKKSGYGKWGNPYRGGIYRPRRTSNGKLVWHLIGNIGPVMWTDNYEYHIKVLDNRFINMDHLPIVEGIRHGMAVESLAIRFYERDYNRDVDMGLPYLNKQGRTVLVVDGIPVLRGTRDEIGSIFNDILWNGGHKIFHVDVYNVVMDRSQGTIMGCYRVKF